MWSHTWFVHDLVYVLVKMVKENRGLCPAMSGEDVGLWTNEVVFEIAVRISRFVSNSRVEVKKDIHCGM
jgi:hypothetical protein